MALSVLCGCSLLDLEPVDYNAAGNYWKTEEQVATYLNGLMVQMRYDYLSPFQLGEERGGTMKNGTSIEGVSLADAEIVTNTLTEDSPGVSNWNGYYARLVDVNHYIEQVRDNCTFLSEGQKQTYLAPAYGIRAYMYFMLYMTYGSVPIETTVKLMGGSVDLNDLYMPRAAAEDVLQQIKDDIQLSEDNYGTNREFSCYHWSWYATQMLKAKVYLWSAKVTTNSSNKDRDDNTGSHTATGTPDLQVAGEALDALIASGKFKLQNNFADIFKYTNKANSEIILALNFDYTVATNAGQNFVFQAAIWNNSFYSESGSLYADPLDLCGGGMHRYEWTEGFVKSFDKADTRRAATFLECYSSSNTASADFGSAMLKYLGHAENSVRYYDSDIILYRYADVLLLKAEVANGLGNQAEAASLINQIRKRAYGSSAPNFTASDYAATELAILAERDKEFVGEGSRWFDLVRMHDASGKPLAFSVDAAYPVKAGAAAKAVISQEYQLLWPINTGIHTGDGTIWQTWGYSSAWDADDDEDEED